MSEYFSRQGVEGEFRSPISDEDIEAYAAYALETEGQNPDFNVIDVKSVMSRLLRQSDTDRAITLSRIEAAKQRLREEQRPLKLEQKRREWLRGHFAAYENLKKADELGDQWNLHHMQAGPDIFDRQIALRRNPELMENVREQYERDQAVARENDRAREAHERNQRWESGLARLPSELATLTEAASNNEERLLQLARILRQELAAIRERLPRPGSV